MRITDLTVTPALRASLERNLSSFGVVTVDGGDHRAAAVAVTIIPADGVATFVLTLRSSGLANHPGQWALPEGGSIPARLWSKLRCGSWPRRSD